MHVVFAKFMPTSLLDSIIIFRICRDSTIRSGPMIPPQFAGGWRWTDSALK